MNLSGAVLLLALAGCATAPPESRPPAPAAETPAAWSASLPAATGWRGFGDPLLEALVAESLAANTDLQVAQAALAQARAQRDVVAAAQSPQVGSSASAGRSRNAGFTTNSVKLGLDASWEVDLFGARRNATAAAELGAAASEATLAATRLAVAGNTALAYLQWLGTREQIAIARESVASQEETLQIVQWRVAAGLASSLDAEQAKTTLEQTRAQLPALQKTLSADEHQLAVLTGRAPAALASRLAAAPATLPALPGLPPAAMPAELLRQRPDVRAAELKVQAELATLAQRDAERLPSFSVSGNLGWAAATLGALGGPATLAAGVVAAIDWPLVDGGAAKARVALQQAVLDGARASYQAAVLAALQDVEDNLAALATGTERVAALERAAEAAANALLLARHRYQAGLVDFTTLLDAQRSVLSARDSLAGARTELWLAHVRLAKALGGAWPAQG